MWLGDDGILQEVPDEDGVVMGAAHDLQLVKLEPEHAAGVLLEETMRINDKC